MARPPLALRVLELSDSCGTRDALVGDLLEEIAHGRSRLWIWQQVIAYCGFALVRRVRYHTPRSGHVIALAPCASLLGLVLVAPSTEVAVEVWAIVYLGAGTFSLFGDLVASRAPRDPLLP
jgi:hypothetical protein